MDPALRFTDRSENYRKYRPRYPESLHGYLLQEAGLQLGDIIADLGSGTGMLSSLFLDHGHEVFAIEPNIAMRAAAEADLATHPNFHSLDGRAEHIPLSDASMDFVVVGQAFHWFDPTAAKREIKRVLKPSGQVALIWNNRRIDLNDFHRNYERLLEHFGTDYAQVSRRWVITDEGLAAWFAPNPMIRASLPNFHRLDKEGLRGLLLSASYAPSPTHPNYGPMLAALDRLFAKYQSGGFVQFEYRTMVYHGRI